MLNVIFNAGQAISLFAMGYGAYLALINRPQDATDELPKRL